MVRVLFYTGLLMLAVSSALLYLPTYFSLILAVIFALLLAVCFIFYKKVKINGIKIMLFILLIFTLLGAYTQYFTVKPAEKLNNCEAVITATVTDRPNRYEDYSVYTMKTNQIKIDYAKYGLDLKDIPQQLTVRISDSNKLDLKIFDKVRLKVTFKTDDKYKNYNLSGQIYSSGYVNALDAHLGASRPFYAVFYDLRDSISKLIFNNINFDEASLISAVLVGDRDFLDRDFEANAKAVGITHVLVVSGGHLGIIFQLLSGVFALLKVRRKVGNVAMLFAIFALEAICGFSPSILRAGLTYTIFIIGRLIHRNPDPLNSLGLATIIILFFNPFGFGNLALMLSLFSTFGLIYLCPIFYGWSTKLVSRFFNIGVITKGILLALCQTLAAIVATTPICILGIGYISLIAPISNLLIVWAINLLTSLTFVTVILLCLPSVLKALAAVPIIILCLLTRYTVYVTNTLAKIPWATAETKPEYIISFLLFILIIPTILLLKNCNLQKRGKIALRATAITLALSSVLSLVLFYNMSSGPKISVLSVGKGISVVVRGDDKTAVIGAGDTPNDYIKIENHLFGIGARQVDYLILPAANKPFAGGAPEFISKQNSVVAYPNSGDYADRLNYIKRNNFYTFNGVNVLDLDDEIQIIILPNVGSVINTPNKNIVVYSGEGDINLLFNLCHHKSPTLITHEKLKSTLEFTVGKLVITNKLKDTLEL